MTASIVLTSMDQQGVATVTLNRPEVHNAYNGALIDALIAAVEALAGEPRVRLLVLRASGKHFQAGPTLPGCRRSRACRSPTTWRSRVAPRSRCAL
jgi:methylglutaconyl-CoA hydratase